MERPQARTIGGLLVEMSARLPSNIALIHDGAQLTYDQLRIDVDRVARGLLALGVRAGDHVAALVGNQPEWMAVCFAVARIGGIFIPLNTWYRQSELDWALKHTDAVVLVYVASFLGHDFAADLSTLIPELSAEPWNGELNAARFPALRHVVTLGGSRRDGLSWHDFLSGGDTVPTDSLAELLEAVQPESVALILYTSGTTAEPKGVTLRHRGVVENAFNIGERRGILSHDRVWLGAPLFYAFGCVNAMPATISHGAALILQGHFTAPRAIETIRRERATVFYGTSNMIRAIVDDPAYSKEKLHTLRAGSAGISREERRILIEEMGVTEATQSYGLTETYGNATGGLPSDPLEIKLESAGKPLPGFELKVVDPVTKEAVPRGQSGLLLLRGYVTDAYFKNPEETARVIDADGWFDTGDLGRIDSEGYFYFAARTKELIKVGGINVSPMEVEQLLLRHPTIRQAYVLGIPDRLRGEAVVAVVVASDAFVESDIRAYMRRMAASFKTPAHFVSRADADIPRLATGKVNRIALRADVIAAIGGRSEP
jgi:fatty-acyl-CoA synthase